MTLAQHQSITVECFTPSPVVEAARQLMGGIDLDPASCPEANQLIQATHIYTKALDGLGQSWRVPGLGLAVVPSRVFLNPPGGKLRIRGKGFSEAALWWARLVGDWQRGDVDQAIFVGFTLEVLRNSQKGAKLPVQHFHRCYPIKRLHFSTPGEKRKSPPHGNVIVYLPPTDEGWGASYERFRASFGHLGLCEPGWVGPGWVGPC